jgi:hypothetical protein
MAGIATAGLIVAGVGALGKIIGGSIGSRQEKMNKEKLNLLNKMQ